MNCSQILGGTTRDNARPLDKDGRFLLLNRLDKKKSAIMGHLGVIKKGESIMTQTKSDNRQGIAVLVAGSIMQLFLGILYVWSVFNAPVKDFWGMDLKLTSSFMLCCFVLGILAGGKIQLKIGAGKIVLIGGLLLAAGMLLTSFIPKSVPWMIYVSYGVLGGFGVGMGYNAIITSAQKWFPTKRGLATGISVCTFGFSTVIFAPLVELMVRELDVVNTFRVLAAVFCVVTLILFRFIRFPADTAAVSSGQLTSQKQFTTSEMFKTKQFYFIALSMMLFTAAYFILNPSFKIFAEERDLASIGTAIVQMVGVASAAGRLLVPILADKIGREKATLSIILATAVSTALLSFAGGALFVICIVVIAFCYGGSSGVYPLVTSEYFGLKHVGSNYGMVMVSFMISAMLFPIVINNFETKIKFIVLAAMAVISGICVLLLMASKKKIKQS